MIKLFHFIFIIFQLYWLLFPKGSWKLMKIMAAHRSVSISCGPTLGMYQEEVSSFDQSSQTISWRQPFHNRVYCPVPDVTFSAIVIKELKMLEINVKNTLTALQRWAAPQWRSQRAMPGMQRKWTSLNSTLRVLGVSDGRSGPAHKLLSKAQFLVIQQSRCKSKFISSFKCSMHHSKNHLEKGTEKKYLPQWHFNMKWVLGLICLFSNWILYLYSI